MRRKFLSAVIGLLFWFAGPALAAEDVKIGVLAFRGADKGDEDWAQTIRYLGRALPQYHYFVVTGDLAKLTAEVGAGQLDFIITNPGHYVELETAFGAARIATVEHQDGPLPAAAVAALRAALS